MKKLPLNVRRCLAAAIAAIQQAEATPIAYDYWISQANVHLANANSAYSKALIKRGGRR